MNRPSPQEFNPFYAGYIAQVPDDVLNELEKQAEDFPTFIKSIPAEKGDFAYAADKWTTKEVIGHIVDTERIMAFRALHFARNDTQELPGFEENDYVAQSRYHLRKLESLAEEFSVLRRANLYLFCSLTEAELTRSGRANNNLVSVRALLFIIAGHLLHHRKVIAERYL